MLVLLPQLLAEAFGFVLKGLKFGVYFPLNEFLDIVQVFLGGIFGAGIVLAFVLSAILASVPPIALVAISPAILASLPPVALVTIRSTVIRRAVFKIMFFGDVVAPIGENLLPE